MSINLLDKIKKVGKKSLITGMIAASMLYSCSKDDDIEQYIEPEIIETELKKETKIIDDKTLNIILNFNDSEISFSAPQNYSVGDILVGGVAEKSPHGILEKIINVSDDKKSFEIEDVSLSEAINCGEFYFNRRLTMNDLDKNESNKIIASKINGYEFSYPIDKVIYDYDGDFETLEDQVRMNGEISFNAELDMSAEFKKGVRYLKFETIINSEANVEIEAGSKDIINSINEEKILYSKNFLSFTILGPAGIPIVINPNIEISAGVVGEFSGEVVSSAEASSNLNNKLTYINGIWENDTKSEINFKYNKPNSHVKTSIKGYVEPKLSLLFYNSSGPFVSLENYLKLNVNTESNPWWTLDAGIDAKVGVDMRRFEKYIPSYEKSIWNKEDRVGEADGTMKEILWEEDFESYVPGEFPDEWVPHANAKDVNTNKIINEGENKILQLYGQNGGCWGALTYREMGIDSSYEISFSVKNGSENNSGCHPGRAEVGLREGQNTAGDLSKFCYFKKDGKLYSNRNHLLAETKLGEWQDIKIRYTNEGERKLTYYLNEEKIWEELGDIKNTVNNLELVVQEGTAWFDNIEIKKIN